MLTLLDRPVSAPDQTHVLRALLALTHAAPHTFEAGLALEVLADAARRGTLQGAMKQLAAR